MHRRKNSSHDIFVSGIYLHPQTLVSVPGMNTSLECGEMLHLVKWIINGSLLDEHNNYADIREFFFNLSGTGTLDFYNIPVEYNGTTIQCCAYQEQNCTDLSDSVILLLQGTFYYWSVCAALIILAMC